MRRTVVLGLATVAALTACGDADDEPQGATGSSATTAPGTTGGGTAGGPAPAASAAAAVPAALDFDAPLVGGGRLDLRAYAGSPVAFWFWAPY